MIVPEVGPNDAYRLGIHMVLSVRLPDRPGALGAVASRIGSLGANITDIVIAGRDDDAVEDTFHLTLPASDDIDLVALLHAELAEVDGVSVQGWHSASCCHAG
jgi:ACT domain-containing protein